MNYTRIATTAEVSAVLHASHPNMVVFSALSDPGGTNPMGLGRPSMYTAWGIKGQDFPIIACRHSWDAVRDSSERRNQKTEYWLCVGVEE